MQELRQIVDSIKKHTSFKRLAAYSIQSLNKKVSPPTTSWTTAALDAFDCGASTALSVLIERNCKDSEIQSLVFISLQSMAAVGLGGSLLSDGTVAACVRAFGEYFAAAEVPGLREGLSKGLVSNVTGSYILGGPDVESVGVTESFLRFLASVMAQAYGDAAALGDGGCTNLLLTNNFLPHGLPTPSSLRSAYIVLDSLARTEAGVEAICAIPSALGKILEGASTLYTSTEMS